jgi:hypothetical protein
MPKRRPDRLFQLAHRIGLRQNPHHIVGTVVAVSEVLGIARCQQDFDAQFEAKNLINQFVAVHATGHQSIAEHQIDGSPRSTPASGCNWHCA